MPHLRRLASAVSTLVVIAALVAFWPAHLGGSTRTVIVSGTSMEPTYSLGDMVVVRSNDTFGIGDVVVFAVPEGAGRGMLVIHRVVDIDADGRYLTQGDNRDTVDQWPLAADDVVGTPILHVPLAGRFAMALGRWPVTAVGLGAMMTLMLWPRRRADDALFGPAASEHDHPTTSSSRPDLTGFDADDVDGFGAHDIDPAVMAEAVAWVEAQLAGILDDETDATTADRRDRPLGDDGRDDSPPALPRREPNRRGHVDVAAPRCGLSPVAWERLAEIGLDQVRFA